MKRYLVIGLGTFGSAVAARLYQLGHEVIVVDRDQAATDRAGAFATFAMNGDATDRKVLEECHAKSADAAVVSTGDDIAASTLAILAVRDLDIKQIYVKVISDEHKRVAMALGATETVHPEREAAEGLASRITSSQLLHYVQYSDRFGIQEMAVPSAWNGKPLRELSVRVNHGVQVVAIHDMIKDEITIPDPDRPLTSSDALLVAGPTDALKVLLKGR